MKWFSRALLGMGLMALLFSPLTVFASSFWENIDFGTYPTSTPGLFGVDSKIYNGQVTGQWTDANGDNNFDADELLAESFKLYDRNGNLVLESPDTVTTRDELEEWALENADLIWQTIFGGSPSFPVGVSDDVVMTAASFGEVVLDRVVPQRKQLEAEDIVNEFKASLEYLSLDINGDSGYALSALLGYSHDYNNGLNFGFLVPYRFTDMDDAIDSDAHYAGLFLFLKKEVMSWDEKELAWTVGGDIFGSAFYAQSEAVSDMGTLKYGGGLFTSLTKYWDSVGLSLGVDYKISEASVWEDVVDNDSEWVQEAIDWVNDLDPVGAFSYGFNIGVPFYNDDAAVNLETIRTHFISDDIDSGRDTQTVLGLTFSYYPTDTFELNIGGRGTFELEDIDIYGITIGSIYRY